MESKICGYEMLGGCNMALDLDVMGCIVTVTVLIALRYIGQGQPQSEDDYSAGGNNGSRV